MNKSYSKIRHILNANLILEGTRFLSPKMVAGLVDKSKNKPNTLSSLSNWLKYPCVSQSDNFEPFVLNDGTIVFYGKDNSFFYYDNNKKMNSITKKMSGWHCSPSNKFELDDVLGNISSFISKLGKSAMETLTAGFSNYPCVLENPEAKPVEGTKNIKITWSNGKTWLFQGDGEFFKYTDSTLKQQDNPSGGHLYYKCDTTGRKIVQIANTAQKSTQTTASTPVTGMGTVLITPQQVATLRTNAGLTGTGNSLTQKDINDLYSMFFHQLQKK